MPSTKIRWPALESNPETMTKFMRELGIPAPTSCVDVLGFDEELLQFLPKPVYAILFCFPQYKKFDELYAPVYKDLVEKGQKNPDWMFFAKQNIGNACGTFALIHAISNSREKLDIGTGTFAKFLENAKSKSSDEINDVLASTPEFVAAHETCASAGETDNNDENIDHHFIAFIVKDGELWEIDSRAPVARPRGPSSEETLVKDVGKVANEYVNAVDGTISFSAIALVGQEAN